MSLRASILAISISLTASLIQAAEPAFRESYRSLVAESEKLESDLEQLDRDCGGKTETYEVDQGGARVAPNPGAPREKQDEKGEIRTVRSAPLTRRVLAPSAEKREGCETKIRAYAERRKRLQKGVIELAKAQKGTELDSLTRNSAGPLSVQAAQVEGIQEIINTNCREPDGTLTRAPGKINECADLLERLYDYEKKFMLQVQLTAELADASGKPAPRPQNFAEDAKEQLSTLSPQAQAAAFQKLYLELLKICGKDVPPGTGGMTPELCEEQWKLMQAKGEEIARLLQEEAAREKASPNQCTKDSRPLVLSPAQQQLLEVLGKDPEEDCTARDSKGQPVSCLAEITCNLARSLLDLSTVPGMPLLRDQLIKPGSEYSHCFGTQKPSCIGTFITAALQDIWGNIEALGQLAKLAAQKAWEGAKSAASAAKRKAWDFYAWMTGTDNQMTESMMAESTQPDGFFKMFKDDPVNALMMLGKGFLQLVEEKIKNDFACAQWSGAPGNSECIKPMRSWSCATCDQRMNAICGVLGVAGGELLTIYLTGGAAAATRAAGVAIGKAGAAVAAKVAEALPKVAEFGEAAAQLASAGTKGAMAIARMTAAEAKLAFDAYRESTAVQAAAAAARVAVAAGKRAATAAVKAAYETDVGAKILDASLVAGKAAVKGATVVTKVVVLPVNGFTRLLAQLEAAGYNHASYGVYRLTGGSQGYTSFHRIVVAQALNPGMPELAVRGWPPASGYIQGQVLPH